MNAVAPSLVHLSASIASFTHSTQTPSPQKHFTFAYFTHSISAFLPGHESRTITYLLVKYMYYNIVIQ